jgi:hypothetical protein
MNTTTTPFAFQPNLIHPVELEFSLGRLRAVNSLNDKAVILPPKLAGLGLEKAMFSILLETFEKLRKAEVNKFVSGSQKEKFKIKMKPYQAFFLEIHIRNHSQNEEDTIFKTWLNNIADQINQKLA